jgi:hypothetical protein
MSVVCCQVEFSATGQSLAKRKPTVCVYVSLSVISCNNLSTPVMSREKEVRKERSKK